MCTSNRPRCARFSSRNGNAPKTNRLPGQCKTESDNERERRRSGIHKHENNEGNRRVATYFKHLLSDIHVLALHKNFFARQFCRAPLAGAFSFDDRPEFRKDIVERLKSMVGNILALTI